MVGYKLCELLFKFIRRSSRPAERIQIQIANQIFCILFARFIDINHRAYIASSDNAPMFAVYPKGDALTVEDAFDQYDIRFVSRG